MVNAVSQVANVVMQYNGSYVNAVYTASAAGYTNPASQVWGQNYAYLQTVESKYDYLASNYEKTYNITHVLSGAFKLWHDRCVERLGVTGYIK